MQYKIGHLADIHTKNREVLLYSYFVKHFQNIVDIVKQQGIQILIIPGDIFDVATPNDSERKLVYSLIGRLLNIDTLLELVFMNGNHDILVDKKQLHSNIGNNSFDALEKFASQLAPELADKLNYLKYQKQYVSKANSKLGYIAYSLENGLSNGNNIDWSLVDGSIYNISIFHDIVKDYITDSKLPVRKDKVERLPAIDDFKTPLIIAGDIHKNYVKSVNGKTFVYCGSSNQVNYAEGSYIKVRKNSTLVRADNKVMKIYDLNLDENSPETTTYTISEVLIPRDVNYVTIDITSTKIVEDFTEQINKLLSAIEYGIEMNFIKLKLSSIYSKYERDLMSLIMNYMTSNNIKFELAAPVYGKFVLSEDDNESNELLDDMRSDNTSLTTDELSENNDLHVSIENLALSNEKLERLFDKVLTGYDTKLNKELGSDLLLHQEIKDSVKSLFSEQLNFVLKESKSLNIQLEKIETNGFMQLGKNVINLQIPGLTRIKGTNGVGKTTLYRMIYYCIEGILFEGLKANQKVKNTLLIFNDELFDIDTVAIRLFARINNTQIAITRTAYRKWKNNTSDENKKSIEWRNYISECTSSVKLNISNDNGQKELTGDEAEVYIKQWFGEIANTILILNDTKIENMLNLQSSKLQQLILDYIGVDYLKSLEAQLETVKLGYNLQRPKFNIDEVRASIITKEKVKSDGQLFSDASKEKLKQLLLDVQFLQTEIDSLNSQLLKIGDLPTIIKDLTERIETNQTEIDNFQILVKEELPIFDKIKPETVESQITEIKSQIDSINVNKTNNSSKIVELQTSNDTIYSKIVELSRVVINDLQVKNKSIFDDLHTKLSDKLTNVNVGIDEKANNLSLIIDEKLSQLKAKLVEKQELLNADKIKVNNNNVIINNNLTTIESGVCKGCGKPFSASPEEFELKKQTLQAEIENLKQINTELTIQVNTNTDLCLKLQTFVDKFNSYKSQLSVGNYDFMKLTDNPYNAWFVENLQELLSNQNKLKTDINKCLLKDYNYFDLRDIITNNETISKYQNIIENKSSEHIVLLFNSEYLLICNNSIEIKQLSETNTNLSSQITELQTKQTTISNNYIAELQKYNDALVNHQTLYNSVVNKNQQVDNHNNKIDTLRLSLNGLKAELIVNQNKQSNYDYLQSELATVKNKMNLANIVRESEIEKHNKLELELRNVDNDLQKLNDQFNQYLEFKKHTLIYGIYSNLVKKEFPEIVFEYYRLYLNNTLNLLLEDINFKLYWHNTGDLYLVKISDGSTTFRPVQLASGMQTTFLGLSLIYAIHKLNIRNSISHIFIDEISGRLNDGKGLEQNKDLINYQNQLVLLLSKFTDKSVFIVDHVIENLYETHAWEVQSTPRGSIYKPV